MTLTVEPGPDAPAAVQASDAFDRTVQNGWGSADKGGAWTTTDGAPVSVADGAGHMRAPAVIWDGVGKRVLTLEWIDGIKLSNRQALVEAG